MSPTSTPTSRELLLGKYSIERALGLRRGKVIPRKLAGGIEEMVKGQGSFDPRKAYRLCQQYPSTAASVFQAGFFLPFLRLAVRQLSTG